MKTFQKKFQKLDMYPLGSIKAEGFLKEQLLIGKDGMAGNLYKLEPQMIEAPYVRDAFIDKWSPEEQIGWQAEISGNYWAGYIMHAFTLNDKEMIEIATKWVDDMLKTQCEDGYLGTFRHENDNIYDDYNPMNSCAYRGLIAFYEATGRKDILDALYRTHLWFCDKWAGDKKTVYAGQSIIQTMIPMYQLTGEKRFVDFAVDYLEFMVSHDIFKKSYVEMLEKDLVYLADHSAGIAHAMAYPALVYSATGEEKYLSASVRRIKQALEKIVHITGGFSCAAEYAAPISSTAEYEYCSFTFGLESYARMCYITGNPMYGDEMEKIFYNGAQGGRMKDEKAIAYLTAPNQILATEKSSTFAGDVQVYAPCYPVACCPVNAVAIVPEFIRSMLMHDADGNVYVMAYGPCNLNYNGISLEEKTLYPFRNSAEFIINCDKKFALNLKIPAWAKGYAITVNGETANIQAKDGFTVLERKWSNGDKVEVTFKAEVEVIKIDDSDYCKKYPLAIKYGALVFSYHIPEVWKAIPGNPVTPLPDGWSFYEARPFYQEADCEDFHERLGRKREQFNWNIVVDENLSPEDITVEEIEPNGYVWKNPPIKLHTKCYKALYLNALYPPRTYEPFGDYQDVSQELPLTLEPYGCTNLRLTYFHKTKTRKT